MIEFADALKAMVGGAITRRGKSLYRWKPRNASEGEGGCFEVDVHGIDDWKRHTFWYASETGGKFEIVPPELPSGDDAGRG